MLLIAAGSTPARDLAGPSAHEFLYTKARTYEPLAWMQGGDRFASSATIFLTDHAGIRALIPSFASSADPDLSFDGKRVLFAGKQTAKDHWQVWEIGLGSNTPRRITNCTDDCVRPFYLPEERIVYAERIGKQFAIRSIGLDATRPLSLTYGASSYFPSDVLRDGRVLLEAISPLGMPELYTVYSDGSGFESYRCDHGKPRQSGRQLASGDIVFASPGGLARFTSARATEIKVIVPSGEYAGDIAETSSGEWLIPWRKSRKEQFQLMWWYPGAQTGLRSATQHPGFDLVQPVLLRERIVPNRHPSALHDWSYANLLCLNAHVSREAFDDKAIQSVRVYTRDDVGNIQLLGMAPVEADGSFYVQTPGDQLLQMELLDGNGKTLRREQGWYWLRRGEQRACVGCHAGPETAPENAVPMILQKSTTPTALTHPTTQVAAEAVR
jgi:hypothetical protein